MDPPTSVNWRSRGQFRDAPPKRKFMNPLYRFPATVRFAWLLVLTLMLVRNQVAMVQPLSATEPTPSVTGTEVLVPRAWSKAHEVYQRLHDSQIMELRARAAYRVAVESEVIERREQEALVAEATMLAHQAQVDRDRYLEGAYPIEEQRLMDQIQMAKNRWIQTRDKVAASERLANQGLLNQKELAVDEVSRDRAQMELRNKQQAHKVLRNVTLQRQKVALEGAVQLAQQAMMESQRKMEAALSKRRNAIALQQQVYHTWQQRVMQLEQEWKKTGFRRGAEVTGSNRRAVGFSTPHGDKLVVQAMAKQGAKVSPGDILATFKPRGLEETVAVQKVKHQQAVGEVEQALQEASLQRDRNTRARTTAQISRDTSGLAIGEYRDGVYAEQRQGLLVSLQKVTEERDRAAQQLAWSRRVQQKGYVTTAEVQMDEYLLLDRNSVRENLMRELAVLDKQDYEYRYKLLKQKHQEAILQVDRVTEIGVARSKQATVTVNAAREICKLEKEYLALLSNQLAGYTVHAPFRGTVRYVPMPAIPAKQIMRPGTVVLGDVRFAILQRD